MCVRGASGVADKAKVSVHPLRGHDVVKLVREVNIGKALESNICNTGPNMCDNKHPCRMSYILRLESSKTGLYCKYVEIERRTF